MKTSLFDRLEKLRARPETHRRQLAFWFSVGITGLVAVVWLASFSLTLAPSPSGSTQVAAVGESNQVASSSDDFLTNQKTRVINGWKVITRQPEN